jgi:group I intron endonuclease
MSRSNGIEIQTPHISEVAFNIKGTNKISCFIGSCIYKITSPSGRIYVGQSKNIEKRLSYYSGLQCVEQRKIYASLVKYGWENHTFEIIETCFYSDINEREKHWISFYNSSSEDNLNILHGGKGSSGRVWTRELRDKLRNANLGRKQSTETIQKRALANTGRKRTEETKKKMSEASMGKKRSPESIANSIKGRIGIKLSDSHKESIRQRMILNNPFKGKKHSEETKAKMREAKANSRLLKNKSNIN